MGIIDREYWKAFENYDQLKFYFTAKKAFKDIPTITADIEADVLTGEVSASGEKGYITYTFSIRPTHGKKFQIYYHIQANLEKMLPGNPPDRTVLYVITSEVLENKLRKILPNAECWLSIKAPSKTTTLTELLTKGIEPTARAQEWTITCTPKTDESYIRVTDSFEEGAREIVETVKKLEETIDPEAIFYKAWNTWREINIYLSEEEAEKRLKQLAERLE